MKSKQVTTEMVLKLPAWVQNHIQRINGLRFEAEQRLKKYLDDQTPSKVSVRYPLSSERKFIQEDFIFFELDNGQKIRVAPCGGHIEVIGVGLGALEIIPAASNAVSIKLSDE